MGKEKRGKFYKVEHDYQGSDVFMFYTLDRPIYQEQIDLLWVDLNRAYEQYAKPRQKGRIQFLKWWNPLETINQDGYGSFKLHFDLSLWDDSTDSELEQYGEQIVDIILQGDFVDNICRMDSYDEEGCDYFINDEGYDIDDLFENYCDIQRDCGYSLGQVEIEQYFEGHLTQDQVAARLLPRLLKGERITMRNVA